MRLLIYCRDLFSSLLLLLLLSLWDEPREESAEPLIKTHEGTEQGKRERERVRDDGKLRRWWP